jgi:hypothetical protein
MLIYLESVANPDQAAHCWLMLTAADMRDNHSRHMHDASKVSLTPALKYLDLSHIHIRQLLAFILEHEI